MSKEELYSENESLQESLNICNLDKEELERNINTLIEEKAELQEIVDTYNNNRIYIYILVVLAIIGIAYIIKIVTENKKIGV